MGNLGNIPSAETRVLMGLDDELYLQKIEMEKKQKQRTNFTPRPPAAPPQTSQRIQAYRTCPNCCTQISPPLASGRQMCRKCGWLGSAVKTVVAAPKPSPPVRDYGWEAIAWITAPFRQMRFSTHNPWLRYTLVLGLTTVVPVFLHFNEQARRGHPLDIHFFEAELSPQNLVGSYNGPGGKDWKIGTPLANSSNAYGLHPLPEMQSFALQLVNRDRILNGQSPLSLDPVLSAAAQKHAEDMLQRDYFAHNTPKGQTPRDRYLAIGGSSYVGVEENISYTTERLTSLNLGSAEKFHKGWMYSNGHRENLLRPEYAHFGYGIVTDGIHGKSYAVQEFSTAEPLR